jgi:hypothetical protein
MYSRYIGIVIRNLGLVPALDMEAHYGDNPSDVAGLYGSSRDQWPHSHLT